MDFLLLVYNNGIVILKCIKKTKRFFFYSWIEIENWIELKFKVGEKKNMWTEVRRTVKSKNDWNWS